jgi:hypothetical protein
MSLDLESLLLEKVNDLIGVITGSQGEHTDLFQALIQCINVRDRVPTARKWTVWKSYFLRNQNLGANISSGLEMLISAAEAGEDLLAWLHDAIFTDKQDALMNDWGIQHYHLGLSFQIRPNERKRMSRTGELLYAIHKEQTERLYLIGVFDHSSFSEKRLLEIVDAEWPEHLGQAKVEHMTDISRSPTSPEIHQFRKHQINSAIEIGGDFFMGPGGGYTMSGHSTKAVLEALRVRRLLSSLQAEVDSKQLSVRFVVQDRLVFLVDETNDRHRQVL